MNKIEIVKGMIEKFKNNEANCCCLAYELVTGYWPSLHDTTKSAEAFHLILEIEQFGVAEGILIRANVMDGGAYYQFVEHVPNTSIAVRFRIILLEKFLDHLNKAA